MISGCCTFFCLLYLLVIYRSFLVCLPTVTLQLQRRYATITTNRSSVDILLVRQPLATAVLFCAWRLLFIVPAPARIHRCLFVVKSIFQAISAEHRLKVVEDASALLAELRIHHPHNSLTKGAARNRNALFKLPISPCKFVLTHVAPPAL